MPKYGNKLKYFSGSKSMKSPFVIVADTEFLLKKMDTCINDPNKSSTCLDDFINVLNIFVSR